MNDIMEQVEVFVMNESGEVSSRSVIDSEHLETVLAFLANDSTAVGETEGVQEEGTNDEAASTNVYLPQNTDLPPITLEPISVEYEGEGVRVSARLQHRKKIIAIKSGRKGAVKAKSMNEKEPNKTTVTVKKTRGVKTRLPCDQCDMTFQSPAHLRRHYIKHSGQRPFSCQYCDKSFTEKVTKIRHEVSVHTHDYRYPCQTENCGRGFHDKWKLEAHQASHLQGDDIPFQCTVCKKRYPSERALEQHKVWHTGVRKYECDICFKKFVAAPGLYNHRKIHSSERDHKCRFCNRGFICRKSWETHERLHTGDLPYQCDDCGKTFPNPVSLRSHKQTHSNIRPFECVNKTCDRKFKTKAQMQTHAITHTKYYPFKCDHCTRKFRRKDTLLEHCFKHTGVGAFNCIACGKTFQRRKHLREHTKLHETGSEYLDVLVAAEAYDDPDTDDVVELPVKRDNFQCGSVRNIKHTAFMGTPKSLLQTPLLACEITRKNQVDKFDDYGEFLVKRGRPKTQRKKRAGKKVGRNSFKESDFIEEDNTDDIEDDMYEEDGDFMVQMVETDEQRKSFYPMQELDQSAKLTENSLQFINNRKKSAASKNKVENSTSRINRKGRASKKVNTRKTSKSPPKAAANNARNFMENSAGISETFTEADIHIGEDTEISTTNSSKKRTRGNSVRTRKSTKLSPVETDNVEININNFVDFANEAVVVDNVFIESETQTDLPGGIFEFIQSFKSDNTETPCKRQRRKSF